MSAVGCHFRELRVAPKPETAEERTQKVAERAFNEVVDETKVRAVP